MTLKLLRDERMGWLGAILVLWVVLLVGGIVQGAPPADNASPAVSSIAASPTR